MKNKSIKILANYKNIQKEEQKSLDCEFDKIIGLLNVQRENLKKESKEAFTQEIIGLEKNVN